VDSKHTASGGEMIQKVKIFTRGLLAPIIGFSLAKEWETA
jgi:hypothetical protein